MFEPQDEIYKSAGLNFKALKHLDSLGLISFDGLGGFVRIVTGANLLPVMYGKRMFGLTREGTLGKIPVGKIMLTEAGRQLSTLCKSEPVDGFVEYATEKWNGSGHKLGPFDIPSEAPARSAASS